MKITIYECFHVLLSNQVEVTIDWAVEAICRELDQEWFFCGTN